MRKTATASGRTRPAVAAETPRRPTARSTMIGRQASEDWVEKATTWAGAMPCAKRARLIRPASVATT